MAPIIEPTDVEDFTSGMSPKVVQALVQGLNAQALRVAPCLTDEPSSEVLAEAKMVLLGAFQRWSQAGSGAVTQQGAGPFQQTLDTRQPLKGYTLWPSEEENLRDLCDTGAAGDRQAFMVDMVPDASVPSLATRPDLWFQWVHPAPPGAP